MNILIEYFYSRVAFLSLILDFSKDISIFMYFIMCKMHITVCYLFCVQFDRD